MSKCQTLLLLLQCSRPSNGQSHTVPSKKNGKVHSFVFTVHLLLHIWYQIMQIFSEQMWLKHVLVTQLHSVKLIVQPLQLYMTLSFKLTVLIPMGNWCWAALLWDFYPRTLHHVARSSTNLEGCGCIPFAVLCEKCYCQGDSKESESNSTSFVLLQKVSEGSPGMWSHLMCPILKESVRPDRQYANTPFSLACYTLVWPAAGNGWCRKGFIMCLRAFILDRGGDQCPPS